MKERPRFSVKCRSCDVMLESPVNKPKRCKRCRQRMKNEWQANNKELCKKNAKKYYEAHKEHFLTLFKERYRRIKANPTPLII